jgi:hypothetical protein
MFMCPGPNKVPGVVPSPHELTVATPVVPLGLVPDMK